MNILDAENLMVQRIRRATKKFGRPLAWHEAMVAADRGYDSMTSWNRDRIGKLINEGRLTMTELPNGDSVIS